MLRIILFLLLSTTTLLAAPNDESRVLGGSRAVAGQFPFVISLRQNLRHICGGAIINSQWTVTSAQCVRGKLASSLNILAGSIYLNTGGYVYNVYRYTVHERFEVFTKLNDIAVVQITSMFTFTDNVKAIPLINRSVSNVNSMLIGWGYTVNGIGHHSDFLNYVQMNLLSTTECISRWSVNQDNVCTTPENQKGYCDGDEGAPIVVNNELAGVFSHTLRSSCGTVGFPDTYTSINYHRIWILSNAL